MADIAGWLIIAAVAMGIGLVALYLMGEAAPRVPGWTSWLHGAAGAASVIAAWLASRGPPRGVASGSSGFGTSGSMLLLGALIAGGVVLAMQFRRRRVSPAIVAIHAMLGIAGAVLFAAWWSAPT